MNEKVKYLYSSVSTCIIFENILRWCDFVVPRYEKQIQVDCLANQIFNFAT